MSKSIKPTDTLVIKLIGDYAKQQQNFVIDIFARNFGTYEDGGAIQNNFYDRLARAGYMSLPINPFARSGESDSYYQSNMKSYGASGQGDWDRGSSPPAQKVPKVGEAELLWRVPMRASGFGEQGRRRLLT